MSRPRIGQRVGLLRCLNRFEVTKTEALFQDGNGGAGEFATVLVKPKRSHRDTVGRCDKFA